MNEYQVRVYFASGRMSYNIGTLIKGDYNSSKLVFDFDDDTGIKMFELLKPDGETKWVKEIVNNEIILADTDELGEVIPLLTQEGTYIFEVAKYDGNSKLTSVKGKFKVKDEQVSTSDIPLEEVSKVELDDLINDVAKVVEEGTEATANTIEQAEYAKQQGDYAEEQARIIIDANTTATKIINDFETNVNEYTTDFNTNAEEKLEAYNQNDIDKTKAYNENTESKENSYNENASNKLKEYNDNATTKLSEYNTNSETKTTAFDTNASEKTDAFNLNVTNKTTDFDSNAEAKTTEFNDNATTKTEEYNTNAESKVNEFNTNVDELKQDVEDCYNNMLTNEVEGTSIHVEDSANARIISLESEGNSEQVTTTGKNKLDISYLPISETESILNGGSYSFDEKTATLTLNATNASSVMTVKSSYNGSSQLILKAGTYYSQVRFNAKKVSDRTSIQYIEGVINVEEDVYIVQWYITCVNGLTKTIYPQIEPGDVTTEYEPYTGGQPSPNPDYPQDVEVVEAYNLFDGETELGTFDENGNIAENINCVRTVNYTEIKPNTRYTISSDLNYQAVVQCYDKNKTFLKALSNNTGDVLTPENAKYIKWRSSANNVENNLDVKYQLLKGTIKKPYTPYGCIRNKFVGKNFFNISSWKNIAVSGLPGTAVVFDGIITIENPTGTDVYTSTGMMSTGMTVQSNLRKYLIEVEPNTEYTISFDVKGTSKDKVSNNSSYYSLFNEKYESIYAASMGQFIVPTNKHSKTITTTADTKYLAVRFGAEAIAGITRIYSNIQIEKSPVPTKFEPYQENTVDINLQGNFKGKIGDIKDTLRIENGRAILTKRIGMSIFDGSDDELWEYANEVPRFMIAHSGQSNKYEQNKKSLCNLYLFGDTGTTDKCFNLGGSSFFFRNENITSVEEWKAKLKEKNMIVIYPLLEPYEVDLGPVNMPKTFEGVTNISMVANLESNMKLKYARSTNIVVDNLAKAIVAMGGEINV